MAPLIYVDCVLLRTFTICWFRGIPIRSTSGMDLGKLSKYTMKVLISGWRSGSTLKNRSLAAPTVPNTFLSMIKWFSSSCSRISPVFLYLLSNRLMYLILLRSSMNSFIPVHEGFAYTLMAYCIKLDSFNMTISIAKPHRLTPAYLSFKVNHVLVGVYRTSLLGSTWYCWFEYICCFLGCSCRSNSLPYCIRCLYEFCG